MLTKVSVIFSLCESDIEALRFRDILFAHKLAKQISLGVSRITLRSNITRRQANRTGVILRLEYHAKSGVFFMYLPEKTKVCVFMCKMPFLLYFEEICNKLFTNAYMLW